MTVEPGRLYKVKGKRNMVVRAEWRYPNGAWYVTQRDRAGHYMCQRYFRADRLEPVK